MNKVLRVAVRSALILLLATVGYALFLYLTSPYLRAIITNDESELFYHPVTKWEPLIGFNHEEIPLTVEQDIIYTYFFKPATDTVKATIFLLHGSGGNVSRYSQMIRPLIHAGFQVYALDWRGFGKSTGRPTHVNLLHDAKAAFKLMCERTDVKRTNIVVLGQSMGGQVAVRLTREFEGQIDALVLDASVASFPSLAADIAPFEFLRKRAEDHPEYFTQPYTAADDIQHINDTPKLIIQSSDDHIVTPIRGRTLFENAREPKEFWQTEGEHAYTLLNYPNEAVGRIEKLIKLKPVDNIAGTLSPNENSAK